MLLARHFAQQTIEWTFESGFTIRFNEKWIQIFAQCSRPPLFSQCSVLWPYRNPSGWNARRHWIGESITKPNDVRNIVFAAHSNEFGLKFYTRWNKKREKKPDVAYDWQNIHLFIANAHCIGAANIFVFFVLRFQRHNIYFLKCTCTDAITKSNIMPNCEPVRMLFEMINFCAWFQLLWIMLNVCVSFCPFNPIFPA